MTQRLLITAHENFHSYNPTAEMSTSMLSHERNKLNTNINYTVGFIHHIVLGIKPRDSNSIMDYLRLL
jgi:hypothetical protein